MISNIIFIFNSKRILSFENKNFQKSSNKKSSLLLSNTNNYNKYHVLITQFWYDLKKLSTLLMYLNLYIYIKTCLESYIFFLKLNLYLYFPLKIRINRNMKHEWYLQKINIVKQQWILQMELSSTRYWQKIFIKISTIFTKRMNLNYKYEK